MIPLFARILALIALPLPWLLAADQAVPAATAERWLADPDSSLRAVLVLAGSLVQAAQSISWQSWLFGSLGVAVGVLRFTPAWGPLIGWCWDTFLAPRKDVAAERAQQVQAQGFQVLVKQIENLPPNSTLATLRDKLARKMPEKVKDAVEQYLDQNGRTAFLGRAYDTVHVQGEAPQVAATMTTEPPKA